MGKYLIIAIITISFMLSVVFTCAADDMNMKDSRRDWYFYKKEKITPETDKKEEAQTNQKQAPQMSTMTPEKIWNMHPDQFKELIEATHKRMVQYPDNDDLMGEWEYLKDIARRKSLAVTGAEMVYLQRHPEYNMNKDVPTLNQGKEAALKEQYQTIESKLKQEKGNYGLLFFYSPDCDYCSKQSGILKLFINKYKWDIKGVDVDRDPGAKNSFNVITTPTLLLVKRSTGDSITIAVGVVSFEDIENTIYKSIRYLNKEITPEQWNLYDYQKGGMMDPLASHPPKKERIEEGEN